MAEGVYNEKVDKFYMVQLRPYFRRKINNNNNPKLLGHIPEEGLMINENQITILPNLFMHSTYENSLTLCKKCNTLYLPIPNGLYDKNNDTFLSHAGLRCLEGCDIFDNTQTGIFELDNMSPNKPIRYYQSSNGKTHFEKISDKK